MAQYNITPTNLQFQVQTALDGNVVCSLYEPQQLSPIRIVYPGNRYLNIASIKNLTVFLPNGKLIPINQLANVELKEGNAEINRQDLQSMGVISARLENSDLGTVIPAIQRNIAQKVNLP